jgi:hypothetical protein
MSFRLEATTMRREFIGECSSSDEAPELDEHETELTVKFIGQACGEPPGAVDVQITWKD